MPGTGSGSQSVEAFHSTWERCAAAITSAKEPHQGLAVMQALYRDGMAAVVPSGTVSLSNSAVNPDYLHNRKLTVAGIYTAADLWDHGDLPNYCTLVNTPDRTVVQVPEQSSTVEIVLTRCIGLDARSFGGGHLRGCSKRILSCLDTSSSGHF